MKKLNEAFPALQPSFFRLLKERIEDNEFTDYSFEKTVNHIIDTFQYSEPKIADFIQYGKHVPKQNFSCDKLELRPDFDPFKFRRNAN